MTLFKGTGVALVTPFNDDLSIDFDALERIINHTIAGGVDFLVALGTTGEPATLSKDEKKDVIAFCKEKISSRVPLVVGAGGNNTAQIIQDIQELDKNGISGLLSVAPYYNKPSQKGIFEHFKAIANSTELPVIIYNVPGRTSANISSKTAIQLANSCKNIVAVKEASGNFSQILQSIKQKNDTFAMLSGDDALTLPMISVGTQGVISVVANSHPREFSNLVNAALKGDYDTAQKYQYQLLDYIDALFAEGSPSGLKAALEIMGLCKQHVRLPLVPVSDEHYVKLQELLSTIN
jgi:4-hydroxy-tetrahydrodipicolinate synthase